MHQFYRYVSLLVVFLLAAGAEASICSDELDGSKDPHSKSCFFVSPAGAIMFNEDCRAQVYPQEFTLKNLGLGLADVRNMKGNILLLGEGFGTLLPVFDQSHSKANVTAIDPIYSLNPIPSGFMGDLLREFKAKYEHQGKLVPAEAQAIPFPDGYADEVFAHMLLNNLVDVPYEIKTVDGKETKVFGDDVYGADTLKTLIESIRVVKHGGRIVFVGDTSKETYTQLMNEVQHQLHRSIPYKIETWETELDYDSYGKLAEDKAGVKRAVLLGRLTILP